MAQVYSRALPPYRFRYFDSNNSYTFITVSNKSLVIAHNVVFFK